MKKTIAILLVAVLAVSSVFAGFSGKATVGLGANAETKEYGFTNGTGFDVNVDLATAESEKVAEGSIYAGVKATLGVKVANKAGDAKGIYLWDSASKGTYGAGLFLKVAEAYVAGENWKVSITGTQGSTSYAKSFTTHKEAVKDAFGNETTDTKDVADDVTDAYFSFNKAPGVTVEYAGFKASVGFNGSENANRKVNLKDADVPNLSSLKVADTTVSGKSDYKLGKFFNYNAFVETKEFDINGLTLQAAVGASRKVDNYSSVLKDGVYSSDGMPKFYQFALNTSAKAGYTNDAIAVSVAADYDAIQYGEKDSRIGDHIYSLFDASTKVSYAPVTVDAYYAYNGWIYALKDVTVAKYKNWAHTLSAQVVTDLATFDIPVKVTVWGKDVLNTLDLGAKAETTIDAFTVSANGGYVFDSKNNKDAELTGKFYVGADAEYKNDLFTAKAGVGFSSLVGKDSDNGLVLTANASVESEAVIPGATVKLAYGAAKNDMNLLKDQQVKRNLGKAEATVTIKF